MPPNPSYQGYWGIPSRRDPLWVCRLFFFSALGHPVPTASPMGLTTLFLFFFRHTFSMFDGHVLWRKQRIGLKFCRTILMDMLQVEVKTGLAEVIFNSCYHCYWVQPTLGPLPDTFSVLWWLVLWHQLPVYHILTYHWPVQITVFHNLLVVVLTDKIPFCSPNLLSVQLEKILTQASFQVCGYLVTHGTCTKAGSHIVSLEVFHPILLTECYLQYQWLILLYWGVVSG